MIAESQLAKLPLYFLYRA